MPRRRDPQKAAAPLEAAFAGALGGRARATPARVRQAFAAAVRLSAAARGIPAQGFRFSGPSGPGERALAAALRRAVVDWAAVTPEDVGAVREALLGARAARRRSGTFYTPEAIVRALLDQALDPVAEATIAAHPRDPAAALLRLAIVDPACGSGHLLIAAARRLAAHVARVRARGGRSPSAAARRRALAEVVRGCVYGVDRDPLAVELCRAGLWLEAGGTAPAEGHLRAGEALLGTDWPAAFPEVLGRGGFDVALANPPWGAALTPRTKAALRARYESARKGALDSFVPFTELAAGLLRPGGRAGLVLPDILLLKRYPLLRRLLLERTTLVELAHWGAAFRGVGLDACTVVAAAGAPEAGHEVRCVPEVGAGGPARSPATWIRQRVFLENKEHRFNLGLSPAVQARLAALRALGPPVGALFKIREGVHSGNVRDRLFLAAPDGPRCRPLLLGRGEIEPGRLRWGGRWIQLDPSRFDAAAGDYLSLGDPALYERPKLLVRRTGDHVLAAPDLEGRWCSNNFFVLVPTAPMPEAELLRACAALNAPEATEYFRLVQPRTGRRFAELKITHLEEIPLPGFRAPPP